MSDRGLRMKSINTFARHADRSRAWVYQQIRAGNLEAVRVGGSLVITAEAEERFYGKVNRGELAEAAGSRDHLKQRRVNERASP